MILNLPFSKWDEFLPHLIDFVVKGSSFCVCITIDKWRHDRSEYLGLGSFQKSKVGFYAFKPYTRELRWQVIWGLMVQPEVANLIDDLHSTGQTK